jgi:hypothetical protein
MPVERTTMLAAYSVRAKRGPGGSQGRGGDLLRGRADRIELVAEEDAAGVGDDGHDGERNAGGNQAILDRGGSFLIGKKRPEHNHRQLLFIRTNVGTRRYQSSKVIDEALARIK